MRCDLEIYVLKEIGSAGPWPGPGVVRHQKNDFMKKLKELKIDAVISGNGGCGLCTPKEMGSCMESKANATDTADSIAIVQTADNSTHHIV